MLDDVAGTATTPRRSKPPPLAMLHGWGLNRHVFDELAAALPNACAFDLPGHGANRSESWDTFFVDLLATLPAKFDLLGWSLGGQAALELAARAPTRVRRLVLIATTPRFAAAPDWPHGTAPSLLDHFAQQLETDYRQTVSEFLELQVRGSQNAAAQLQILRERLLAHGEPSLTGLRSGLERLRTVDLRPRLGTLTMPALVITGQYDRVTNPASSSALAEQLPAGEYVEIRRAGHAPFLSHPRDCIAAIEAFLGVGQSVEATA
jgi:pimeloyl-[acyl-carrier protein] methyl ester esterase